MNPPELIAQLKNQHATLRSDLAAALLEIDSAHDNQGELIVLDLVKFKADLLNHLKLENEVFYPDLLAKKNKMGVDVLDTKHFIAQMDEIGIVVMGFLKKYEFPATITGSLPDFKKELLEIIETLNLRIEIEEEGIFDVYLSL
ncbi:MAG: hemerythrin domain-containing protein [Patescibacteria group bacterium]